MLYTPDLTIARRLKHYLHETAKGRFLPVD
jgi:hypothetical protein